jgi:iron complex outermembrane receptor protein
MTRYALATLALLCVACSTLAETAITVDEIVVTARKKEESALLVPLSVSAFSEQSIRDLGLNRLGDIARFTPGFSFAPNVGRQPASDRPVVRGLTTVINGIANTSAAATFIDGVYFGGSIQSSALYNVERVEVLRGPQSAQYGRGTYAGAINYVTRNPGDELAGEVIVNAAEHDTTEVGGWLGGPLLGSSLDFYLAGGHREYGGEYVNTVDGRKVGGEQTDELTAKLRWTPADSLAIAWQVAWQGTDDEHYASYLQPQALNNCCFRTPQAPRAREYYAGTAVPEPQVTLATDLLAAAGGAGTRLNRWRTSLDIEWTLGAGYVLKSLTGYVDDELERGFDSSYGAYEPVPFLPGLFTIADEQTQTDFSQELRLSSPLDRSINWTIGGYYYAGELDDVVINSVYRDPTSAVVVAPARTVLTRDEIENLAAFGSIGWDISEHWSTSLELRWARDEITVTNRANDGSGVVVPPSPFTETFDSLTPRVTLSYLPADDRNYYVSVAKGTKPGDFNARVPDERYRAVDEEQVWSYEAGFKARWLERATSALAAYYMDVDDQQLTTLVELPDGSSVPIIQNVGRSAIWGIEADLTLALTERLGLNLTYAYTHAEYREHISIDEADLRGSDGSLAQTNALGDVSGNRLPRVPEHMASALARYEHPLRGSWLWYLNGDYSYESSKFAQEHNLIKTGERHLAGLRTGLNGDHWDVSIWVTNLLDDDTPVDVQRYFDSRTGALPSYPQNGSGRVSTQPRGFVLSLPRGRQYGATLRFRF